MIGLWYATICVLGTIALLAVTVTVVLVIGELKNERRKSRVDVDGHECGDCGPRRNPSDLARQVM